MNSTEKAQRISIVAKWHGLHGWVATYYADGEYVTDSGSSSPWPDLSDLRETEYGRRAVKRRLKKAFPEADSVFVAPVFSS